MMIDENGVFPARDSKKAERLEDNLANHLEKIFKKVFKKEDLSFNFKFIFSKEGSVDGQISSDYLSCEVYEKAVLSEDEQKDMRYFFLKLMKRKRDIFSFNLR